jgi:hypothetical protein
MKVTYNEEEVTVPQIIEAVQAAGYQASPKTEGQETLANQTEMSSLRRLSDGNIDGGYLLPF